MTDFYKTLIEKTGFDEALIGRAFEFEKEIDISAFSRLFFDTEPFSVEKTGVLLFADAFYPFAFFDRLKETGVPTEEAALYVYILLLERSFGDFSGRICDSSVFFDTAKKLVEAAAEYFAHNVRYGLYDYRFLANHVRGSILRLGSFEYQYGNRDGKRAIILHIPDGANLSSEKKAASYRLAREYFGNYPIIADSWLLYPENKKMLSEDSNIASFMDDFDIISSSETTDYSELFHIFGRLNDFSYKNLPKSTTLQKAYAERVKSGLPVGSGIGVLKY